MSADILRRAAALMRERARAVWAFHSSPWHTEPGAAGWSVVRSVGTVALEADDAAFFDGVAEADHDTFVFQMDTPATAEHIASWHPAVALAVADWLDRAANLAVIWEWGDDDLLPGSEYARALAVARAYLGESE